MCSNAWLLLPLIRIWSLVEHLRTYSKPFFRVKTFGMQPRTNERFTRNRLRRLWNNTSNWLVLVVLSRLEVPGPKSRLTTPSKTPSRRVTALLLIWLPGMHEKKELIFMAGVHRSPVLSMPKPYFKPRPIIYWKKVINTP